MGFSYHKPTRSFCPVCEALMNSDTAAPLIDTCDGRASSANGYPFHDWYHFVLGYTPTFPEYMLSREQITSKDVVLDPFVGSGTTQLVCKLKGIASYGLDANDFMVFAASQKLNWTIDSSRIPAYRDQVLERYRQQAQTVPWDDKEALAAKADENRPAALDRRYLSDKPLVKINCLKRAIQETPMPEEFRDLFLFAVSAILVPVSNVKYGPGFGIGRKKEDADVLQLFSQKLERMTADLSALSPEQRNTFSKTILGDSRRLSEYIAPESVSLMITSPPYPGDHEYTKHSKLELIFNGYATDLSSFRTIKKRMIRGSTTNIYRQDHDRQAVEGIPEIKEVTDEIEARLAHDGATSGFEKLYTKLVWEYFGGMAYTLEESLKVLRPGGKIALLISDSHAFKMVHIKTAELLEKVGEQVGFVHPEIILWQMKNSTSHKYQLRENILILQKK